MNSITGIVRNGQIAISEPISWPEGTEVRVKPVDADYSSSIDEGDILGDDPESIARWIEEFDAIPPLQMTPSEEAEWQAARTAQRSLEKATFNTRIDRMWNGHE